MSPIDISFSMPEARSERVKSVGVAGDKDVSPRTVDQAGDDFFEPAERSSNKPRSSKNIDVSLAFDLKTNRLKGKKNNLGNHMHDAIMNSDEKKFDQLMSLSQNVSCRVSNKSMPTPLHVACRRGSLYFVKGLLDAGADPLFRVGQEKPPLHLFLTENRHARREYVPLVKELLKHGASPLASVYSNGKKASELMTYWVREPVFAEIRDILVEAEESWPDRA